MREGGCIAVGTHELTVNHSLPALYFPMTEDRYIFGSRPSINGGTHNDSQRRIAGQSHRAGLYAEPEDISLTERWR